MKHEGHCDAGVLQRRDKTGPREYARGDFCTSQSATSTRIGRVPPDRTCRETLAWVRLETFDLGAGIKGFNLKARIKESTMANPFSSVELGRERMNQNSPRFLAGIRLYLAIAHMIRPL
jgi:hypothetical protein